MSGRAQISKRASKMTEIERTQLKSDRRRQKEIEVMHVALCHINF